MLQSYLMPTAITLAESIERDLLSLHSPIRTIGRQQRGTPAPLWAGWPGGGVRESVLDCAETILFNAPVPASFRKYLALNPFAYSEIRKLAHFKEYACLALSPDFGVAGIYKNFLVAGIYKNFLVVRSPHVPTEPVRIPGLDIRGAGAQNLAFSSDAMGLVTRKLPAVPVDTPTVATAFSESDDIGLRVVMTYAPGWTAHYFTVDMLYGVGILREEFAVQVLT